MRSPRGSTGASAAESSTATPTATSGSLHWDSGSATDFPLIWRPSMDALLTLLSDPAVWMAFLTLTALELVLGIDNIIFISILVDKLPKEQQETARRIGLGLAMFGRVGCLFVLWWSGGPPAPLSPLPLGGEPIS